MENIKTAQVEGGRWQASFIQGGLPNQFGDGATEAEAIANLQKSANLQEAAHPTIPAGTIGHPETKLTQVVEQTVDRVITKKLQHPVELNGKTVNWTAYRESDPATQSYGVDEQGARVQFLTDEGQRQSKAK